MFDFTKAELAFIKRGEGRARKMVVDVSDDAYTLSELVLGEFEREYGERGNYRVVFDTVAKQGFVVNEATSAVIADFAFKDEVFWRSILDEAGKGSLAKWFRDVRSEQRERTV